MNKDKLVKTFNEIESQLNEFYYERDKVIRGITVGLLSNLNIILVGPPGTGKTAVSESFTSHIDGAKYFGTTLNPFTSPEEVFGAFDLVLMRDEGIYNRRTEGYLPSAHIVAIEEIFKAGKGMLNSLIEVSHPSRLFSNGPKRTKTPILTMIGTSNELPVGEKDLSAIYDRMIIKMYVKPINDSDKFKKMLGGSASYGNPKVKINLDDIAEARKHVEAIEVSDAMLQRLTVLRGKLDEASILPSDRTMKLSISALKAHAFLSGRDVVEDEDITFLRHLLWHDPDDENRVWRVIIDLVKPELKRLGEILEAVTELVQTNLPRDAKTRPNIANLGGVHVQIQKYIDEATQLRAEMSKKSRNIEDCEDIIGKLREHLSKIGKLLIGYDDTTKENMFK